MVMTITRKILFNFFLYGLVVFIFYFFVKYFLEMNELSSNVRDLKGVYLTHLIVLTLGIIFMRANMSNQILKTFNVHLSTKEWMGLGVINSLMQYVLPLRSGTLVKSLYLKKIYNFNISESASIMIYSNFICYQTIFSFLFLFFTYNKISTTFELPYITHVVLLFGTLFFLGILFMLILEKIHIADTSQSKLGKRVNRILHLFVEGMKNINRNIPLLIFIIISYIGIFLFEGLRFYYAYMAMDVLLPFLKMLIITAMNYAGTIITITPGQLGIQEVLISFTSQFLGFTFEKGFVAVGIIRAIVIIINILLSVYFAYAIKLFQVLGSDKSS